MEIIRFLKKEKNEEWKRITNGMSRIQLSTVKGGQ